MRQPGERVIPYKMDVVVIVSVSGVKKRFWHLLGCPSSKCPQSGAFAIPLTGGNVLFRIFFSVGVKNISSHAHKSGTWFFLGVLFKISHEHPPPPPSFYMEIPPLPGRQQCDVIKPGS